MVFTLYIVNSSGWFQYSIRSLHCQWNTKKRVERFGSTFFQRNFAYKYARTSVTSCCSRSMSRLAMAFDCSSAALYWFR